MLKGLTITHGSASYGGAIYLSGASPLLRELTITENNASVNGGGIYVANDSQPTLIEVSITYNTAGTDGGGIGVYYADLTLSDSVLSGNVASDDSGGLEIIGDGQYSLTDVEFSDNLAYDDCGGARLVVYTPGALDIDAALIDANAANHEGAGLCTSGNIVAQNSVVSNNVSGGNGGGIYTWGGVTFSNLVIDGNRSEDISYPYSFGGGIYVEGTTSTIQDSTLVNNHATHSGGGICVPPSQRFDIENTVIVNNGADENGGGVQLGGSSVMRNVLVAGNTAEDGGGVFQSEGTVTMENILFLENSAVGGEGGGVYMRGYSLTMRQCTIHRNTADYGAGLFVDDLDELHLLNSTVTENTADTSGGGIRRGGSGSPDIDYSNFWGNSPEDYGNMTDQTGLYGNISVDAEYLDDSNADPTFWDLHLDAASALVHAGSSSYSNPDGSRSDMGAYGGGYANDWDLDLDGYPEWWLPGAYDAATSPGMDCDDRDEAVYPLEGC